MTPTRKIGIGAFLLGSIVGGAIGINGFANAASNDTGTAPATVASTVAATDSTSTTSDATDSTGDTSDTDITGDVPAEPAGQPAGPHTANGITEEVVTGDTASSVQAAVLAAYPDATIERMETDAEGAAYEAHVTLAEGCGARVKLVASFRVTSTETGPDGGGPGRHGGNDGDDDDTTAPTATTADASASA
jgi:hypothetical protein